VTGADGSRVARPRPPGGRRRPPHDEVRRQLIRRRWRRNVAGVDEIEIRFTEQEVAKILWILSEASDLAAAADALSSLAMIEETLRMVRERFDRRRPE
jgi:hypothetical protein